MSRPREDRAMLLKLLSTERYVPIEEINALLGTTSAASYVIIKRLRDRGVAIECVQGVGYRHVASDDRVGHKTPARDARRAEPGPETFGGALKRHRVSAGLTQTELAGRAVVAPSYISCFEWGSRGPSREVAGALTDALGLSPLERDRLLVLAGYCPPSIARLSARRLESVLILVNEEAA